MQNEAKKRQGGGDCAAFVLAVSPGFLIYLVLPDFFQTRANFSLGQGLPFRIDPVNLLPLESVQVREHQGVSSEHILKRILNSATAGDHAEA